MFASKNRKPKRILPAPILLSICLLILIWKTFYYSNSSNYPSTQRQQQQQQHLHRRHHRHHHHTFQEDPTNNNNKSKERIAILIPFVGENGLPPYFPLFQKTAQGSSDLIDFFIIHNGGVLVDDMEENGTSSSNVKFIDLKSTYNMAKLFLDRILLSNDMYQDTDTIKTAMPYGKLIQMLSTIIDKYPYVLVEFKPAYGHIFQEFISGYTHWGYSDLDIAFGDLPRWISPSDELREFDIVTYGYGDQNRLYLRGQFTFHKNSQETNNQIWRACEYLSKIDERYANVASGKEKLHFESAEGCYSYAVLQRDDIKVKYAVKAFTDIDDRDTIHSDGLYISMKKNHRGERVVLYKAETPSDSARLSSLPLDWYENNNKNNNKEQHQPMQFEVGPRTIIETKHNEENSGNSPIKCMYWAPQKYQLDLCIPQNQNVEKDHTIFFINGVLYKQKYLLSEEEKENGILSLPLFHFQEWKRLYRPSQISPLMSLNDNINGVNGFILTKEGVIPISSGSSSTQEKETDGNKEEQTNVLEKWSKLHHNINGDLEVGLRTTKQFCLRSSRRKNPPFPKTSECINYISWSSPKINILRSPKTWASISGAGGDTDITLTLTLQITPNIVNDEIQLNGLLDLTVQNLRVWGNNKKSQMPAVLLIHASFPSTSSQMVQIKLQEKFGIDPSSSKPYYLSNCLVAVIYEEFNDIDSTVDFNPTSAAVSRKALLNMAFEAAPTRFVISGIEIERGLVLSKETPIFAKRASLIYGGGDDAITGNIFIIPQFTFDDDDEALAALSDMYYPNTIKDLLNEPERVSPHLRNYDCNTMICNDENENDEEKDSTNKNIINEIIKIWWSLTKIDIDNNNQSNPSSSSSNKFRFMANANKRLSISIIRLLHPDNEMNLRDFDINPILMIDRIGPSSSSSSTHTVITEEIAPEIEEFGGSRCYNFLRLAKLVVLGYNIQTLVGAFAISNTYSRKKSSKGGQCDEDQNEEEYDRRLGLNRCDGCFMFDGDDDEEQMIVQNIFNDERNYALKTSMLWYERGLVAKKQ